MTKARELRHCLQGSCEPLFAGSKFTGSWAKGEVDFARASDATSGKSVRIVLCQLLYRHAYYFIGKFNVDLAWQNFDITCSPGIYQSPSVILAGMRLYIDLDELESKRPLRVCVTSLTLIH